MEFMTEFSSGLEVGTLKALKSLAKVRIEILQKETEKRELDGVLIFKPASVYYYAGISAHDATCVGVFIPKDREPISFVLFLDRKFVKHKGFHKDICVHLTPPLQGTIGSAIVGALKSRGYDKATIGVEGDECTVSRLRGLREGLPNAEFVTIEEKNDFWIGGATADRSLGIMYNSYTWIDELRMVKDPEEIGFLREASRIANDGMSVAADTIRPGVAEFEIAAEIEYRLRREGMRPTSFRYTEVASGERTLIPHAAPTERKIRKGDLVVVRIMALYQGYWIHLARTFSMGPSTRKQKEMFSSLLSCQNAALEAIAPGATGSQVCAVAARMLNGTEFIDLSDNLLGHGIGAGAYEPPSLQGSSYDVLAPNMVVSLFQYGLYSPAAGGGVQIEDPILVTGERGEFLGSPVIPRELIGL